MNVCKLKTWFMNPSESKGGRLRWIRVRAAKPEKCSADELHYVRLPNTNWRLALWRYLPSPHVKVNKKRQHPLLMLSGVATNAVGFDLSPQYSFARHMSGQGFDTWVLEVRGAGLSIRDFESSQDLSKSVGGSEKKVEDSIPLSFRQVSEEVMPMIEDFRRQLDLFLNSDWDFDELLKQDLPLVVEYIRKRSNPSDGRLFGIGHSMGGIMLYAMLSLDGYRGGDSDFAAIVTLVSSLDYSTSKSSLKLLLPLADPAKALNIPSIPIGAILATMHPFATQPPYFLSWLKSQISAQDMMLQEDFDKLVLNNFCTIPAKLLLQLATAFESTGLRDRTGTFLYKDHIHKSNVPILALGGDRDLVCPPEAVYETVKMIPEHLITYKVFGEPDGPHYGHFDLVGGRFAAKKVYPCIIDFLTAHDRLDTSFAT